MPLPDFFKQEFGTAIIWGQSGGAGVTDTLSFNNLANNTSRQGDRVDLGARWNQWFALWLIFESGTAPTAGNTFTLYMATARVTGEEPGGLGATDADFQTTQADNDEHLKQLGTPHIILAATNDANTTQRSNRHLWMPGGQYVIPVTHNTLGVALRNQGTPSDNTSRVILQPLRDLIQDAA